MKQGIAPVGMRLLPKLGGTQTTWILPVSSSLLALTLVGSLALGFFTDAARSSAERDKATLDKTIADARKTMFVPDSLLMPILRAETAVPQGVDGTPGSYQQAATQYTQLTAQIHTVENTPVATARSMAQADITSFTAAVAELDKGGYIEATGYHSRLKQAQTDFDAASTTRDYFKVDSAAQGQVAALKLFSPTYDQLQAFTKMIDDETSLLNGAPSSTGPAPLQCALGNNDYYWVDDPAITLPGTTTSPKSLAETQWAQSDLLAFRTATTASEYQALSKLMKSQTQQAQANEITLLPTAATDVLKAFGDDMASAKQSGVDVSQYEAQYTADSQQVQALSAKPTVAGYTKLITTIRTQTQGLQLPVLKAKTASDVATLKQLVAQGQASVTIDPANGIGYPNAYEYADPNTGVGDATQRLAVASTLDDYKAVDTEVLSMTENIKAMLANLNDKTPSSQVHQTDLQLLSYYQVTPYRVIVVSLREQVARMYDNGQLVKEFNVTTGAPDLPSIPGIHCVQDKQKDTVFKSPDPPGSPNYYAPTPIHFAMYYSDYGYELHDAWWRSWFGKYSNLPHYDPSAFNGGSHGCVNFALADIPWLYDWSSIGTPVIIY